MKIWKKIITSFVLVIIIMIIVDYNSYLSSVEILKQVNELELSNRKELKESNRLAFSLQRIKSSVRELFIEYNENVEFDEITRADSIVRHNLLELEISVQALQKATSTGYSLANTIDIKKSELQEIRDLDVLVLKIEEFSGYIEKILSLQSQLEFDEADNVFELEAEPISREIQKLISSIILDSEEEVAMAIQQMQSKLDNSITTGVYLSLLAVVLAISISLIIAYSITKPIRKIILMNREISKGNFDVNVNTKSKGEVKLLIDSFNKMSKDLQQQKSLTNKINKELKELNATKDKLFSIIAHDLRSPFNSILGFSELMSENIEESNIEELKSYSDNINTSAQNSLNLLDNLLNWANSQTSQLSIKSKKIMLSKIILEVIELKKLQAKNKNISLNYTPSDEFEVYSDENMLKLVFRNLISNSIKFTKSGGKINVSVILVQNHVEISVSDNGVGMSDETRKKLFDISTSATSAGTENEKGSGLGLVLCKEFVEKLNGKIWVESEEGKGSNFKFTLPINKLNE